MLRERACDTRRTAMCVAIQCEADHLPA